MSQIKIVKLIDADGQVFGVNQDDGDLITQDKIKGYTGSSFQFARLDPSSFALEIASHAEVEVHEGNAFCAHIYEADFDKIDEIGILFTTPDTAKHLHILPKVYSGAAALFQICEAPTMDTSEYSVTFHIPTNRNRNKNTTSGIKSWRAAPVVNQYSEKVVADASPVTADGTVIHSEVIGSGKQGGGGPNFDTGEYILKRNTTYYFRLAGMAGGADNSVSCMELYWFEVEDRE